MLSGASLVGEAVEMARMKFMPGSNFRNPLRYGCTIVLLAVMSKTQLHHQEVVENKLWHDNLLLKPKEATVFIMDLLRHLLEIESPTFDRAFTERARSLFMQDFCQR